MRYKFSSRLHHGVSAGCGRPEPTSVGAYRVPPHDSSLGWPRCSDAYDSGAVALAHWLGSTLKVDINEGSKVQRTTGQLQGMACHSSSRR